ncbi:MAG: phosphotransferase enzyme family protein [Micromonosporaceae bacterium]
MSAHVDPWAQNGLMPAAQARLGQRWNGPVVVETVIVAHHERVVFTTRGPDGRLVVVKADTDTARLSREYDAMAAASRAGLPVPDVVDHVHCGGPALLVTGHVPGGALDDTGCGAGWRHAAGLLRRLHDHADPPATLSIPGNGSDWWALFRWWVDHEVDTCKGRGLVGREVLSRLRPCLLEAFTGQQPPPLVMLHGDCRPEHWLIRSGTVTAVIDFGDACLGDPVWELAVMTAWHPARLPALLDGYQPSGAVRQRLNRLWTPYRMMRQLAAVAWMHDHGQDPTTTVTGLAHQAARLP